MYRRVKYVLLPVMVFVMTVGSALAQTVPTAEEIAKIAAAAPQKPAVAPKKPRKVLIFSLSWGYKHSSIPYGKAAFEILGKKTGAYEPVVSDDISMFEPQNLKQFDAVVFNNTNNEIFLPEDFDKLPPAEKEKAAKYDKMLKNSLVSYLKSGGGLAVTHAGVASFRDWPEFGNIIGARFDNHPWVSGSTVTLRVEEPDHPVMQAFAKPLFEVTDEIYQVTAPYSRDNLRVLMSIDVNRTTIKLASVGAVHRTDNDFAMTWIKDYGKGRVFYCALGHDHDLFWNTTVLQHYLDGVQFAAGDLEGDAKPVAKQTK